VETTEALSTTSVEETTTTTTTMPPTVPPTTSVEDVEAEVAATYIELDAKSVSLLKNPRKRGLPRRAAEIAIPGTPYFERIIDVVTDLVDTHRRAAANDPDLRSVTVEGVELVGRKPFRRAVVTVCQVDNGVLVVDAEASPVPGDSIVVGGTGELEATRLVLSMRLTADGWRHASAPSDESVSWEGARECPAG
jgi:hypothetical protein